MKSRVSGLVVLLLCTLGLGQGLAQRTVRPGRRVKPCDMKPLEFGSNIQLPNLSTLQRSLVSFPLRIVNPSNCAVSSWTLDIQESGNSILHTTSTETIASGGWLSTTPAFRAPLKEGQLNFTITVTYTKGRSSVTSDPRNRVLYVVKPPEFDEALRVVHGMSEPGKNRAKGLLDDVRSDHWWASDTNPRYHTLRGIVAAMESFTNPTVEIRHCTGLDSSCYHICNGGWCYEPEVHRLYDYDAAFTWLDQAIWHDPTDVEAHYWKWRVLYFAKIDGADTRDEQKAALKACAAASEVSTIPFGLREMYSGACKASYAHLRGQDPAPYRRTVKRSIAHGAPPAFAHFLTGWVDALTAQRTGKESDWYRAINSFTRSLDVEPGFAHNLYYRGLAWDKVGRKDNMLIDLYDFIVMAPDAPQASMARAVVCGHDSTLPGCRY